MPAVSDCVLALLHVLVRPARQSESYPWTLLRHYPQHRVRHAGYFKGERRRSHGTGEPAHINVCVGTCRDFCGGEHPCLVFSVPRLLQVSIMVGDMVTALAPNRESVKSREEVAIRLAFLTGVR